MNGVYDFEQYPAPYLDEEDLRKRKAQKRKRRLLILTAIAGLLVAFMCILLMYLLSKESQELCLIIYVASGIYMILSALLLGNMMKKGEVLCEL